MKKSGHSKSTKRQAALGVATRVLRLRIKDKHAGLLLEQSREVDQVWNYSQDLALKVLAREHRFMSAYDMAVYTKGATKEGLSLHSQTVQAVSEEYCIRRKQFKKAKLRWRVSHEPRLKDLAALSNRQTVEAQQFYRDLEPVLAVAQRAGHDLPVAGIIAPSGR